jgi:M6 family metalloprotease-like protein
MRMRGFALLQSILVTLLVVPGAAIMPPSKPGTKLPDAYYQRLKQDPNAFSFAQSYVGLVQHIQANRYRLLNSNTRDFALAVANMQGGILVGGTKTVPVVTALYSDTPIAPYDKSRLQQEYFDGPWPTGTLTELYTSMSYGNLTVKGIVLDWQTLSKPGLHYAGDDYQDANGQMQHCLGLCLSSRVGELIRELLDKNPGVDWGQFDNDGPDRKANSGDDDGYVDFIAIVHPGIGGECTEVPNNTAIWSHRGQLTSEGGAYTTHTLSAKLGVGNIKVNDYVIVPALACDGVTPNPIGVVSHEFGHAFGLPDLYDTTNAMTGGVGDWDLMATGAWGGDDISPETPTQMSAWSKAFLGWVTPIPVQGDIADISLDPIELKPMAYQVKGSGTRYYLITNRQKLGSDAKLPTAGLLVEAIDPGSLTNGWTTNTVNVNPVALGVQVIEADGGDGLVSQGSADRQDPGDLFPGAAGKAIFDSTTNPATSGTFALCDIRQVGMTIHARLIISSTVCNQPSIPNVGAAPPGGGASVATRSTVAAVNQLPDSFTHKVVQLFGVIENVGSNYFTDQRLVLTDQTGRSIPVQLSAPVEVPPAQTIRQQKHNPKTISSYLDKPVIVTGSVDVTDVKGQGKSYVFRVTNVQPKQ